MLSIYCHPLLLLCLLMCCVLCEHIMSLTAAVRLSNLPTINRHCVLLKWIYSAYCSINVGYIEGSVSRSSLTERERDKKESLSWEGAHWNERSPEESAASTAKYTNIFRRNNQIGSNQCHLYSTFKIKQGRPMCCRNKQQKGTKTALKQWKKYVQKCITK